MIESPTPEKLKTVRAAMGFTQREAAEIVHVFARVATLGGWRSKNSTWTLGAFNHQVWLSSVV